MNLDLSGKVSIVTGSSRGIGNSIARKLASAGSDLILNGIANSQALEAEANQISKEFGVKVLSFTGDVSDSSNADKLAKIAFQNFKRLDILVNNAGVLKDSLIGMIKSDDVDSTLSINLKSVIYLTQSAARLMARSGGGSIINISSIIGRYGNKGQIVYASSKAGVIGATIASSKELAPSNIRVNTIAPGFINTDMTSTLHEDIYNERINSIAMKRIGEPNDIANAALFLASDLSNYITGQVLGVDGGMIV